MKQSAPESPVVVRPGRSGLTKPQTRTALSSFNVHQGLRTVFDAVCGGTGLFFTAYALSLGVAREYMGYVAALVSVACLAQLLGVALNSRVRRKKLLVLTIAIVEPVLLAAAVVATPLVPAPWRITTLAIAIFAAASLLHMTRPTTEEWLASTIPASLQGRYLGRRFQLISALALATILVTAWLGDWARNQADSAGLAAILCVGAAFGLASVFPLTYARLPMVSSMAAVTWRDLPGLVRVRDFRNYVIAILLYNLPFVIATPFYFVFMLEVLNLSMAQAALMQAPYQLTKIMACRTLGPTMNRIGPRRMLQLAAPIYIVFFIMFAMSANFGAWLAFVAWFLVGWADGMWNLASPSLLYRSVPAVASRQAFFAAFNFCVLGLFAIGGVVGVSLLKSLDSLDLQIGGWIIRPLTAHYLVSAGLMVLALLAGYILPDPQRTRPPSAASGGRAASAGAPPEPGPDQGAAST